MFVVSKLVVCCAFSYSVFTIQLVLCYVVIVDAVGNTVEENSSICFVLRMH